jgi:hypothetical protein
MLAGRFTRSPAARALVVAAFAVNGRWALQIASGHTWHLAYEWTPWVLYFYDRAVGAAPALGAPRRRDVVYGAACIALMVYMGGIYPLPQTVFVVALYGLLLAALTRSARPIFAGVAMGGMSLGLSAPKLLPVLEVLRDHPRFVESNETVDLVGFMHILTSRDQDMGSSHPGPSQWGWHEWGMYVGWAIVLLVVAGSLFGRGRRESPLKWVGLFLFVLGFGSFDPHAPWPLVHQIPIFKSQHVPSRWQYPGILLLATVAAALVERVLRRTGRARGWLEVAMVAGVAWIAYDVAQVAHQPVTHMFPNRMPQVPESTAPLRMETHVPPALNYAPDWAPPALATEMANVGTLDCSTFPALHNYFRDWRGRAPGMGAHGASDAEYRGEAFIADGVGKAQVVAWSPNEVTVSVTGAQPGEHVLLNQNWDSGWRANGEPAQNWSDTVAAQLHDSDATIVFRYRPRLLVSGLVLFAMTAAGIVAVYVRSRRGRGSQKNREDHEGVLPS